MRLLLPEAKKRIDHLLAIAALPIVLIVISSKEPSPWAVEDSSLAAQNLMLAAYAAGLGTCWIGFAQHWLGTPEGKATLKLGPECIPVAPIIVGYPKTAAAPVPRKDPDVRWIG